MNQTLVDNATLDFLVESTKKYIRNRIKYAGTFPYVEDMQKEILAIENDLKKFNEVEPHFVTKAILELNELKPISTTEL